MSLRALPLLAALGCASPCLALPRYRVVDLGFANKGYTSEAMAVNDFGLVGGWANQGTPAGEGFLWTESSGARPLRTLAPSTAFTREWECWDVNNAGQACGRWFGAMKKKAAWLGYRYTPGRGFEALWPLPGYVETQVYALNDSGWAVGESWNFNGPIDQATLWVPGHGPLRVADLGNGNGSVAIGINDAGVVVGVSLNPDLTRSAFRWTLSGGTDILDRVPGFPYACANDINGSGWTAGFCENLSFGYLGTVWKPDGSALAVTRDGQWVGCILHAINSRGEAVGHELTHTDDFGIYWTEETGAIRVDDLLTEESIGWHVLACHGINASGWLAGVGSLPNGVHPILLIPER